MLICTGDRDAFQLVDDQVTVLYPRKGVSDLRRIDAGGGARQVRPRPRRSTPTSPPCGETRATTCPTSRRGGEDRGQVDRRVRLPRRAGRAGRRGQGQGRRRAARPPRPGHAEPAAHRARPRRPARPARRTTCAAAMGPRRGAPGLRHARVPGAARPALRRRSRPPSPEADEGFEVDAARAGVRASCAAWLAEHAAAPVGSACHMRGYWGHGTGEVDRLALAARRRSRRLVRPGRRSTPADEQALRRLAGRPRTSQGVHDAKGPMLALAARGWQLAGLASDTALSAYLALPGQRIATTWPTSRCATSTASCGPRRPSRRTALTSTAATSCGRGETRGGPGPRRPRPGRRARRRARAQGRRRRLLARSSCRWSTCSPRWSAPASPSTSTTSALLESTFACAVKPAADDAYAVIGREINLGSPKQLQVVLFDELGMPKTKRTKTGYTTDADALQTLLRADRAPVPRGAAAAPRRDPAAGRPSTGCSRPSTTTAASTRRSTRRSPRPDGCRRPTPTCRTSRSAPRRAAGSARRSSSGEGYESLMTADYSQIEMRIMAHLSEDEGLIEAFTLGRGPARVHRVAGVRRAEPADVTGRACGRRSRR